MLSPCLHTPLHDSTRSPGTPNRRLLLPLANHRLQGSKLPRLPAVIGEFGVADHADFNAPLPPGASDYTSIKPVDVTFLADLAEWLARKQAAGAAMSWWWWAWNANSGAACGGPLHVGGCCLRDARLQHDACMLLTVSLPADTAGSSRCCFTINSRLLPVLHR